MAALTPPAAGQLAGTTTAHTGGWRGRPLRIVAGAAAGVAGGGSGPVAG